MSFKAFAEKYNKEKESKVVKFSDFSGKKPPLAGQLNWSNADGTQQTDAIATPAVVDTKSSIDLASIARPLVIGIVIGSVVTLIALKYKKNG